MGRAWPTLRMARTHRRALVLSELLCMTGASGVYEMNEKHLLKAHGDK